MPPERNVFVLFSFLDFFRKRHQLRRAAGAPVQQHPGQPVEYHNISGAPPTRCLHPVLDAHFGFVLMNSGVEHSAIVDRKGRMLGLPAHGPSLRGPPAVRSGHLR